MAYNENNILTIKFIRIALNSLTIYRKILKDEVLHKLYSLVSYMDNDFFDFNKAVSLYCEFFSELIGVGIPFCDYLKNLLLSDENPLSLTAEIEGYSEICHAVKSAARHDLIYLQQISEISSDMVKSHIIETLHLSGLESKVLKELPEWGIYELIGETSHPDLHGINTAKQIFNKSSNWSDCLETICNFHHSQGVGIFARYRAFVWESSDTSGFLRGIENPDPVSLSDLIEYESERSEVIRNTLNFLDGHPANNVLLYGDRGTGKSSTVKAILNEYYVMGLRVIEVPKKHLIDFPKIVRLLKGKKQKFIIFVDDLAFEDNEENYTALKAALEGGLENKPSNVLIYATSNRRHLIKEKFSDRTGLTSTNTDDEIRSADNIQEKLSLADRFGITVIFSSPGQSKYLEIVEGIASKRGLKFNAEQLRKEAVKWELWYNGRSPRTARQFVDWYEGQMEV